MKFLEKIICLGIFIGSNAQEDNGMQTMSLEQIKNSKPSGLQAKLLSQLNKKKIGLVEKITTEKGKLVIPYSKYILANGLTVIISEDHSDPIVNVNVTYHVGSARETLGRSGFAHFFEHMMFQGSENVADEEHFKIIESAGGRMNGTTNKDRTNYFETVPSNYLETVLWLEADRMGFLLDAVTQEKFEIQRATVKNERGQNYDNKPYGMIWEKSAQTLYPYNHSYSWLTIGYIEDLNRVDVEDLKRFFLRWYAPNNATLVITGDVNTEEAYKMVEQYFSAIPMGPIVTNAPKQMIALEQNFYVSLEDKITMPQLDVVFSGVHAHHPDEAPLDVLLNFIGGDNQSALYQKFVKSKKAVFANAESPCYELAGELDFSIRIKNSTSLKPVYEELMTIINNFDPNTISAQAIQKYINNHEASVLKSLGSVDAKGFKLADYSTFEGNTNFIDQDLQRYKNITQEDLIRVYNQYLKNKKHIVLSTYPLGKKELIVKEDNFIPQLNQNAVESEEYKNLANRKVIDDNITRIKPKVKALKKIDLPIIKTITLSNGIPVNAIYSSETPEINILITLPLGHLNEKTNQSGIGQLLCSWLNESTKNYSSEALTESLALLGSSIVFGIDNENITISINTLDGKLEETIKLLEDKIFNPKFQSLEFDFVKSNLINSLQQQLNNPQYVVRGVFKQKMFESNSPYSLSSSGSIETITNLKESEVKNYYDQFITQLSKSKIFIAGNLQGSKLEKTFQFLENKVKANTTTTPKLQVNTKMKKLNQSIIYFVDKPKAPQSQIYLGASRNFKFDVIGAYFKADVSNYNLGGNFNSRINYTLREEKGDRKSVV